MSINEFLQWKAEYSIGIDKIDNQHKELMELIKNLLKICMVDSKTKFESFNKLASVAMEKFRDHFASEEALMLETNYPKYAEHKKRHDKLLEDVKEMMKKIPDKSHDSKLMNVVIFMREWFVETVHGTDKEMGIYLNEYGQT
jgi:hemerythrin